MKGVYAEDYSRCVLRCAYSGCPLSSVNLMAYLRSWLTPRLQLPTELFTKLGRAGAYFTSHIHEYLGTYGILG